MVADVVAFFQQFALFSMCSRRNAKPTKKLASHKNTHFVNKPIRASSQKALDEHCNGGLSNASTCDSDPATGSTDDSDTDGSSRNISSTFAPPPGLDKPSFRPSERLERRPAAQGTQGSVPVRNLRNLLQDEQITGPGTSEKQLPASLAQVLKKLSPQDVATVQAALKKPLTTRSVEGERWPRGEDNKKSELAPPPWRKTSGYTQRYAAHDGKTGEQTNVTVRTPVRVDLSDDNTLRANLRKLALVDSAKVLMVKKINKLGLNSPKILKAFFSKFGVVETLYVTHSIDKRKLDDNGNMKPRVRPAGLGFLVMAKAEDAAAILKAGSEQVIYDVTIQLTTYENHLPQGAEDGDENDGAAEGDVPTATIS